MTNWLNRHALENFNASDASSAWRCRDNFSHGPEGSGDLEADGGGEVEKKEEIMDGTRPSLAGMFKNVDSLETPCEFITIA